MNQTNLEFLLKEKYGYSDTEIFILKKDDPKFDTLATDIKKEITLLEKGYPIDYMIGFTHFLDSKIDLSLKPLIPRPETEYWVSKALQDISPNENLDILDLFTGSGCIGIAAIRSLENSRVTFSDISNKALKQVEKNLIINGIKNNFEIIKSDIFSKLKDRKFDLIFANPPYIDKNHTNIGEEIKYEPKEALFADSEGFAVIEQFLSDAFLHLNDQGKIYMEFGYNQKEKIENLLSISRYESWKFNKDQFGKWRWIEIIL